MDFEAIDREMSRRVNAVYGDPKRHKFYSCFQAYQYENFKGPRGGKVRGRKRICFHCGLEEKGHALETEKL